MTFNKISKQELLELLQQIIEAVESDKAELAGINCTAPLSRENMTEVAFTFRVVEG